MSEERTAQIAVQLCRILEEFHSCTPAIVNRDIKPSNLKLSPDGVVKLLDLNAAKWSSEQAARDTVLLGTMGYAAPEQYGFGPSSVLTDIYSVGVLMNVMLTGQLPNQCPAGGRLGRIIRTCTELSPSGRYQSVAQLREAIGQAVGKQAGRRTGGAWRAYLPPGYRGGNALIWLLATFGYAMLFYICTGLTVEGAGPTELLLNRVFFTLAVVGMALFNGNYLGVQRRFALTGSRRRWVRWLGMAVMDFAILFLAVIVLDIFVSLLVG